MAQDFSPREKSWKQIYTRSNKIHRAKQLGFIYPREGHRQMLERESLNVLFVCSMNQWRSPTAERVFTDKSLVNVRSRGTSRSARRTVMAADLKWADVVFVMEEKHHQRLNSEYPREMRYKEVHVLDIPDDYQFMDPDLVEELRQTVGPILDARS